jgi:hypothetical protein
MDEIWFWMAKFIAELLWLVGLVVGLIAVTFVVAIFLSVVNWLLGKIKKIKGKRVMETVETINLVNEYNKLKTENERLRHVLQSISNNTCCDNCQEAALVARAALKEKE